MRRMSSQNSVEVCNSQKLEFFKKMFLADPKSKVHIIFESIVTLRKYKKDINKIVDLGMVSDDNLQFDIEIPSCKKTRVEEERNKRIFILAKDLSEFIGDLYVDTVMVFKKYIMKYKKFSYLKKLTSKEHVKDTDERVTPDVSLLEFVIYIYKLRFEMYRKDFEDEFKDLLDEAYDKLIRILNFNGIEID